MLTFDFQGYTNVFVDSLPDPDNIEVFQPYESFYRLLVRATDPDPARRFASAQEMAEQLTGVLREVVALQTGRPRPALSTLFGPELRVTDTELFAELTGTCRSWGRALSGLGRGRGELPAAAARAAAQPGYGRPAGAGRAVDGQPSDGRRARRLRPRRSGPGTAGTAGRRAVPGGAGAGIVGGGAADASALAPHLAPLDARATALALPVPRVDPNDPNAGFLAGLLASAPAELIAALHAAPAALRRRPGCASCAPGWRWASSDVRRRGARRPWRASTPTTGGSSGTAASPRW